MKPNPIVPDQAEVVHGERRIEFRLPARPKAIWVPHPDVLREYRWVREWRETWNPLPMVRESYRNQGWAWWVMWLVYIGFLWGAIAS